MELNQENMKIDVERYKRGRMWSKLKRLIAMRPSRRKRGLVVEDCPITCAFLMDLLNRHGYDAYTVSSGEEARHNVAQAIQAGKPFDVALIDLGLPGISGLALAKELRGSDFKIPLVAVTGSPSIEKRMKSMHAGFDMFLSKKNIEITLPEGLELFEQMSPGVYM